MNESSARVKVADVVAFRIQAEKCECLLNYARNPREDHPALLLCPETCAKINNAATRAHTIGCCAGTLSGIQTFLSMIGSREMISQLAPNENDMDYEYNALPQGNN